MILQNATLQLFLACSFMGGVFWYMACYIYASFTWDVPKKAVRKRATELWAEGVGHCKALEIARVELWNQHLFGVAWNTWPARIFTLLFGGPFAFSAGFSVLFIFHEVYKMWVM